MSNKIQFRRGTTVQRANTVLGQGEPGWDTDQKQLYIGDGVTPGGLSITPGVSFKNKLINGDFRFAQRGTSQSTDGYGSVDRWRVASAGSSTYTVSRQVQTPGALATLGAYESGFYAQIVVNSSNVSTSAVSFNQRIEDVHTFSGQTVTVSGLAYADAPGKKLAIEFLQNFGTSGSADVSGIVPTGLVSLGTGWTPFSVTINVPSVSGKTIGANSFLSLNLWFDAGSSFNSRTNSLGNQSGTFRLVNIQAEQGIGTPYEVRPYQLELSLCQRYYCKSFDVDVVPALGATSLQITGIAYSTNIVRASRFFPVNMRASPSVTYYADISGGTLGQVAVYNHSTATWAFAAPTNPAQLTTGFQVDAAVTATAGGAYMTRFNWTADADL